MVEAIFQDSELQSKFEKQGYVKIPFLSPEEVKHLVELFWSLHPNLNTSGFQSSSYSSDYDYKKKASDLVTTVFKPHYERIFKNYRTFGSAYLYKQPDNFSALPIHQDWTIVDEERFVALNVWVPLVDVNSHNGALYVMPGSQYGIIKPLRCPTLPMFFNGHDELMIANSVPMELKAGEAIVLNQSIVHYSPPNKSNKIRIAITSGVMSLEPKMQFHYCPDVQNNEVEVIEMEDDFLIRFENFHEAILKRPVMGRPVGTRHYEIPQLNEDQLKSILIKMKERAGLPGILTETETETSTFNTNTVNKKKKSFSFFHRLTSLWGK